MPLVDNTLLGSAGIQRPLSLTAPRAQPPHSPAPLQARYTSVRQAGKSEPRRRGSQAYLSQHARSSPTAPRVPEVYTYATFTDGAGNAYLVMEHIDALSFRAWIDDCTEEEERELRTATAVAMIAEAVVWLLAFPIPEGGAIGRVGGGCIQHRFFGIRVAPVAFVSAAALEEYVNQALVRCPRKLPYDPTTRRIWVANCQHINVLPRRLPELFFCFYLHSSADAVARAGCCARLSRFAAAWTPPVR
ncbi:hypothetical protein B0H12DRAFT_367521 [Mycena haematopus]|nr:hypothetical protein B0H12DRAFT_367521 [Mycena haematopus]